MSTIRTPFVLPAGTYYIGDLCYIMSDEDWDEAIDLMYDSNREYIHALHTMKSGAQFVRYHVR
jgi:hypothetical protein